MALNWITAAELTKHLPAQILSLGYPDNIDRVNLRGSSLNVVDLFQHKGWERIVDLSYPQDLGSYDIVLDCGTIEHCSNPAQAFINAASAVKVGGVIIHDLPVTMVNHGYWNICPAWFKDFYTHNGFTILESVFNNILKKGPGFDSAEILPWPPGGWDGLVNLPPQTLLTVVARRTTSSVITLPKCESKWGH
jgi:hypothetical protein